MLREFAESTNHMNLKQMICLLRFGGREPATFSACYERLVELLPHASPAERQDLYQLIRDLSDSSLGSDGREGRAFQFGTLMATLGFYEEAITHYERSQSSPGNANTELNLGVCFWALGSVVEARACLNNALALDEGLKEARILLRKIDPFAGTLSPVDAGCDVDNPRIGLLEEYQFIRSRLRETDVRLNPLLPCHAQAVYENGTPDIMHLARLPVFDGLEDATDWVYTMMTEANKYSFAITDGDEAFVGMISATVVNNAANFFFWIGRPFWGRGYGTAAACRLLSFVFDSLGLDELFTCILAGNYRSIRIIERLGFLRICVPDGGLNYYRCGLSKLSDAEAFAQLRRMLAVKQYDVAII